MTLEQAINHALERGELTHLSVITTSTGKFRATFASASRAGGYYSAEATDPIVAMVRAIGAMPSQKMISAPSLGKSSVMNAHEVEDEALS